MRVSDARVVDEARRPLLTESSPPPPRSRARDAHLRRDMRDRTPRTNELNHDQPAGRSQPGITVRHERPPWVRAEELDSSNSTPEVPHKSTTIRVSTARACPEIAVRRGQFNCRPTRSRRLATLCSTRDGKLLSKIHVVAVWPS